MTTADRLRQYSETDEMISNAFLDQAADEIEALLKDKKRLDWLEKQGNGSGWVARNSTMGRGFRLHNTFGDELWHAEETPRAAIDAAMKGETE